MVIGFLCCIGALASGIALMYAAGEWQSAIVGFLGFLLSIVAGVAMLAYGVLAFDWVAAEHKARIINREYGTSYTREEVFYASNVIDTVRELDRKRIELNGNLINGEQK